MASRLPMPLPTLHSRTTRLCLTVQASSSPVCSYSCVTTLTYSPFNRVRGSHCPHIDQGPGDCQGRSYDRRQVQQLAYCSQGERFALTQVMYGHSQCHIFSTSQRTPITSSLLTSSKSRTTRLMSGTRHSLTPALVRSSTSYPSLPTRA